MVVVSAGLRWRIREDKITQDTFMPHSLSDVLHSRFDLEASRGYFH